MEIRSIGSPLASFDPEEPEVNRGVLQVQRALNRIEGEALLPENGIFTPETQTAVLKFQQENGLPATGLIDAKTTDAMQIVLRGSVETTTAARSTSGTGPQDLNLAGMLAQSRIGNPVTTSIPTLRGFMDGFQNTLPSLAPMMGAFDIRRLQPLSNPVLDLGANIGLQWSLSAVAFQTSQPTLYPGVNEKLLKFSEHIGWICEEPDKLNPQNWMAVARCGGEFASAILNSTNSSCFDPALPLSFPGAASEPGNLLKENGEMLAVLLAGAASGATQPFGAAGIQILSGAAVAIGSVGAGFAPLSGGIMLPMISAFVSGLFSRIPELLARSTAGSGLRNELGQISTLETVLLNLTTTSIAVTSVLISQRQELVKMDREIATQVTSAVRSENEISSVLVNDALQQVLKHCEVVTRDVIAASVQAMISSETILSDQSLLAAKSSLAAESPEFVMQHSVKRVLDIAGRIIQQTRSQLLPA